MTASMAALSVFPLSVGVPGALDADGYRAAIARGVIVIDIRTQAERAASGALPGALAIAPELVESRLDPASHGHLVVAADPGVEFVLVSGDGGLAEIAVRALRNLGLRHSTYVVGGLRRLAESRLLGAASASAHIRREAVTFSSH